MEHEYEESEDDEELGEDLDNNSNSTQDNNLPKTTSSNSIKNESDQKLPFPKANLDITLYKATFKKIHSSLKKFSIGIPASK